MWCPEGYYSWEYVLEHLIEASEKTIGFVTHGIPVEKLRSAERGSQEKWDYSVNFRETDPLSVSIVACFLMTKFLREFPPTLANLDGRKINATSVIFEHKDQLDYCNFAWPVMEKIPFCRFFEYSKNGKFRYTDIYERFAFINPRTGQICLKNGSKDFLLSYVVSEENEANKIIGFVQSISGFVVCWPDVPDEAEFREFLSCLEVDATFKRALDFGFGSGGDSGVQTLQRPVGRPSKRIEALLTYRRLFPKGHEVEGKLWKQVHQEIELALGKRIDLTTIKRAVSDDMQKE